MKENKQLSSHALLRRFAEDIRPMLMKDVEEFVTQVRQEGRVRKKRTPANLRWPYSYYHGVFYHTMSLVSAIDRLGEIKLFLSSFPAKLKHEKHGISQDKWVRDHTQTLL